MIDLSLNFSSGVSTGFFTSSFLSFEGVCLGSYTGVVLGC